MKKLRDLLARLFRRRGTDPTAGEDPRDVRVTTQARAHSGVTVREDRRQP